jgi:formylglycine-generating enzyme
MASLQSCATQLRGYWIDKEVVTNAQFARFVAATHYVTVAERKPRAEDFPNASPELLVAGSVVFNPPTQPCSPGQRYAMVELCTSANWRHPQGPASDIKGLEMHPVVHIAYEDALAHRSRIRIKPGGKHMANTSSGGLCASCRLS